MLVCRPWLLSSQPAVFQVITLTLSLWACTLFKKYVVLNYKYKHRIQLIIIVISWSKALLVFSNTNITNLTCISPLSCPSVWDMWSVISQNPNESNLHIVTGHCMVKLFQKYKISCHWFSYSVINVNNIYIQQML